MTDVSIESDPTAIYRMLGHHRNASILTCQ